MKVAADARTNDRASLFGESATRAIVSTASAETARVLELAAARGVPARVVGRAIENDLRISVDGRVVIDRSVADAERLWAEAIESRFRKRVA